MNICIQCNNSFIKNKQSIKRKFCSCSCAFRYRIEQGTGPKKKLINNIECPECRNSFHVCPSIMKSRKTGVKFCSLKCKSEAMKKGKTSFGFKKYAEVMESNPRLRIQINGSRYYIHRLIMENHIGRKLKSNEHVHHINENPKDNRIENLLILTAKEHSKIHAPKKLK